MNETFESQHLCMPKPQSEHQIKLRQLARQYVEECEAYDRTVCTGPIERGAIMPRTSEEWALSRSNAHIAAEQLRRQAKDMGISAKDFNLALMKARMKVRIG
jgi:hypothetical protein